MAKLIGAVLPDYAIKKMEIERGKKVGTNEVILLASVDDAGFPNVALLSFLDLKVISRKRILVTIGRASSTKRNLLKRRAATLIFWDGGRMLYMKCGAAFYLEHLEHKVEGFETSAFIFTVKRVSEDYSAEAEIKSTLTYDPSGVNDSHELLAKEIDTIVRKLSRRGHASELLGKKKKTN